MFKTQKGQMKTQINKKKYCQKAAHKTNPINISLHMKKDKCGFCYLEWATVSSATQKLQVVGFAENNQNHHVWRSKREKYCLSSAALFSCNKSVKILKKVFEKD